MPLFEGYQRNVSRVLYVDIGGTSIRTAELPSWSPHEFFSQLEQNTEIRINRRAWDPGKEGKQIASIIHSLVREKELIGRVAIAITGEVTSNGRRYTGWMSQHERVPKELASCIENEINLPTGSVSLINDAAAWGQGARALMRHCGVWNPCGVGLVTVGTGVAFSVLTTAGVSAKELNKPRYNWGPLCAHAGLPTFIGSPPHIHIGRGYFDWRSKQKWDDPKKMADSGKRLQLLLDELKRQHQLDTFLIAGGYAEQYEDCALPEKYKVEFLTNSTLGYDPGFIPMIGLNT